MQRSLTDPFRLVLPALLLLASSLMGQLRSDLPLTASPGQLKSVASPSWLDPQRFNMSHSFSVSFVSGSQLSPGASLSVYTNQMRYLINNNLMLSSNLYFVQPGIMSSSQLAGNNLMVYYQANMDWWLSDKINIHLGISNLPPLRRYSPWYPPVYAPFQGYRPLDHLDTTD